MYLKNEFLSALLPPVLLPTGYEDAFLLGHTYEEVNDICSSLISVLSYGSLTIASSFSCRIKHLNCHILLYIKSGNGTLSFEMASFPLIAETLLLFDARQTFRLSGTEEGLCFDIFYLNGSNLDSCLKLLHQAGQPFSIGGYTSILQSIRILEKNGDGITPRNTLLDLKCFTDIFTELGLIFLYTEDESSRIPSYLTYMKNAFDFSYASSFSLKEFEHTLEISKFRLCREFTHTYGTSPLQYLNGKRMDAAKELLSSTDIPVHEIGTSVGIENTNHFINLFKKHTGITPYVYRKKMLSAT